MAGLPKGRLFPVSRDDLVECAALLRSIARGELDRIVSHDAPLDVLAQQIVAETACDEYAEDELFALVAARLAVSRALARPTSTPSSRWRPTGSPPGAAGAARCVHRDEVNGRCAAGAARGCSRITSGGAIPEVADYRVVLEPDDTFIGTLNEDFAIESMAGDVFQLGNASWQVLQVGSGTSCASPTRRARRRRSRSGSAKRRRAATSCRARSATCAGVVDVSAASSRWARQRMRRRVCRKGSLVDWLLPAMRPDRAAAEQVVAYLPKAATALGVLPTQDTLVLERFFDESGGMQLVLHAPFGSRINKAWGLALRKRFCRQFNFELQAAATEDALLLSLGPQHSFPLADVFRYLHPATARDVLVQAFLDAPVFQTRWRWNTTISLAVPRNRSGKKVAPQLQRMLADDLMAAVFPDAAACLENIPGDREIPDHPLVTQTVRDCLEEAMDFEGLAAVLDAHSPRRAAPASRATRPSRRRSATRSSTRVRTRFSTTRRSRSGGRMRSIRGAPASRAGGDLGALDAAAIARVLRRSTSRPARRRRAARRAADLRVPDGSGVAAPIRGTLVRRAGRGATRRWQSTCDGAGGVLGRRGAAAGACVGASSWRGSLRAADQRADRPARAGALDARGGAGRAAARPRCRSSGRRPPTSSASRWRSTHGDASTPRSRARIAGRGAARHVSAPGSQRARVVRSRPARADPSLHAQPAARRDRAGQPADFMRFLFDWQHADPGAAACRASTACGTSSRTLDGFELPAARVGSDRPSGAHGPLRRRRCSTCCA